MKRISFAVAAFLVVSSTAGVWADEFEVTKGVHRHLPFLKKDVQFFDSYPGNNPGHGERHLLIAKFPNGVNSEITKSSDLKLLIDKISSPEEALQFVRFLSSPPGGLDHPIEFFKDVPFVELQEKMGTDSLGLRVDPDTLAKHKITKPEVSGRDLGVDKKEFIIKRYVFFHDQTDEVMNTNYCKTIGRVTEVVSSSGDYSFETELLPVENFRVEWEIFYKD